MKMVNRFMKVIVATIILAASAQVYAVALDAEWSHGNVASLQSPTSVKMNKFGWGAVYTVPFRAAAWTHFTLPTTVIEAGVRSKLQKVLVQYNGNAVIDRVDVWDGPRKIASQAVNWTGNHLGFGNWGTVMIPNFPQVFYGVSVSLRLKNPCTSACAAKTMTISGVGGDFFD